MRLSKKQILEQIKNNRKKFSSELGVEFKKIYVENTPSGYISTFNSFLSENYPALRIVSDEKGKYQLEKIEPYCSELNPSSSNKTNQVYPPTV